MLLTLPFRNTRKARSGGKLADLIVLGHDPLREDPFTLVKISIERAIACGQLGIRSEIAPAKATHLATSQTVLRI